MSSLEDVLEEEIKLYQKDIREMHRELRKYTFLEAELGIDLITLFKALKDGKIYFNWYGEIKSDTTVALEKDCFGAFYISTYNDFNFYLKDYGKTWSLSRYELEVKDYEQ